MNKLKNLYNNLLRFLISPVFFIIHNIETATTNEKKYKKLNVIYLLISFIISISVIYLFIVSNIDITIFNSTINTIIFFIFIYLNIKIETEKPYNKYNKYNTYILQFIYIMTNINIYINCNMYVLYLLYLYI